MRHVVCDVYLLRAPLERLPERACCAGTSGVQHRRTHVEHELHVGRAASAVRDEDGLREARQRGRRRAALLHALQLEYLDLVVEQVAAREVEAAPENKIREGADGRERVLRVDVERDHVEEAKLALARRALLDADAVCREGPIILGDAKEMDLDRVADDLELLRWRRRRLRAWRLLLHAWRRLHARRWRRASGRLAQRTLLTQRSSTCFPVGRAWLHHFLGGEAFGGTTEVPSGTPVGEGCRAGGQNHWSDRFRHGLA